jgi:hypothetical protein
VLNSQPREDVDQQIGPKAGISIAHGALRTA